MHSLQKLRGEGDGLDLHALAHGGGFLGGHDLLAAVEVDQLRAVFADEGKAGCGGLRTNCVAGNAAGRSRAGGGQRGLGCGGDAVVGGGHLGQHSDSSVDKALNGGLRACLGLVAKVHRFDVLSKRRLQLVHGGREVGLEVGYAPRCVLLLLLQRLPVGYHCGQLLVGGACHAGDRVHAVGATVSKGGDHVAQPLDVGAAVSQGLQVGVVVLPVGDLTLQCGIDAACAGCNDLCGLVPKLILPGYALVCCTVRLVVGYYEGTELLLDSGDRRLKFCRCCGRIFHGSVQLIDRFLCKRDFLLSSGHSLGVLVERLLVIPHALLSRPNFIIDVINGVLQIVILLAEEVGGVGHAVVFLVVRLSLLRSLGPQLVHSGKGIVQPFAGLLLLILRICQADTVFLLLDQHGSLLLVHLGQLLLVRLLHGILAPRLGIGSQGIC